jgi:hypothetical protein
MPVNARPAIDPLFRPLQDSMSTANIPAPKLSAPLHKSHQDRQPLHLIGGEAHDHLGQLANPLAERITAALAQHPYFRRRPPAVQAESGRVTLHGEVATFYHKQVAQEMIRKFDGVHAVENLLHVTW